MARYKIWLEYDGSRYNGWQLQKGAKTVMGEVFTACEKIFKTTKFELYGAGRTDAGVHALGQVAHLQVDGNLPAASLQMRINDLLPADINVLQVENAAPAFHARHSATARSYVYVIAKRRSAFGKKHTWWIKDALDVSAMKSAAEILVGMHDFRGFTDPNGDQKSTKVELIHLAIHETSDRIIIHIAASHFLWKMVRRITGTLVEVGRKKLKLADVKQALERGNVPIAQFTAPPSGLYLEHIYYQNEPIEMQPRTSFWN